MNEWGRNFDYRTAIQRLQELSEEWNQQHRHASATSIARDCEVRPIWLTPMPCQDLVNRYFDLLWLHEIGIAS